MNAKPEKRKPSYFCRPNESTIPSPWVFHNGRVVVNISKAVVLKKETDLRGYEVKCKPSEIRRTYANWKDFYGEIKLVSYIKNNRCDYVYEQTNICGV